MDLYFEGQISAKAVLESRKRKVDSLILQKGKRTKDIAYLRYLAKRDGIPVKEEDAETIQQLASSKSHGGVLVKAQAAVQRPLPEKKLKGYLCFIDGIEDPYQLGSACRTLYAFGCSGLILNQRDWKQAEPIICKASAGTWERMDLYWTKNEDELVQYVKVYNIPLFTADRKDAKALQEMIFPDTFCLAIGGALRGLRSVIRNHSDQNIVIEYGRDFRYALDTVGAISTFSYEIARQRRK